MKFGQTSEPGKIDFQLPDDHPETAAALAAAGQADGREPFRAYVGCAKWNRKDLKGLYPRGTKDELTYYASQFNAIELNATFYRAPDRQQTAAWAAKTPDDFLFFPKIPRRISHIKRLLDFEEPVLDFCAGLEGFDEKLGMVFLQMHNNFKPGDLDRIRRFVEFFPEDIPLALELRNTAWFTDPEPFEQYSRLLAEHNRTNIIVDSAGRRDLLHMRLTSDSAFVRYVGANHESDYTRLDNWVERVVKWRSQGLRNLYFFVHQNIEEESPRIAARFIRKLNEAAGLELHVPVLTEDRAE